MVSAASPCASMKSIAACTIRRRSRPAGRVSWAAAVPPSRTATRSGSRRSSLVVATGLSLRVVRIVRPGSVPAVRPWAGCTPVGVVTRDGGHGAPRRLLQLADGADRAPQQPSGHPPTPGVPMTDTTTLIQQLRALMMLTQTEEQIARIRVAQARTDAVRRELQQNAGHAAERTAAIAQQLRALGGVADVVPPAMGRIAALLKGTVEQAGPIDEALLGDLQLEHQLLDRATYLKVLAQVAKEPEVERLAERLITAHSATVEWLTVLLAESALGGPARPPPPPPPGGA